MRVYLVKTQVWVSDKGVKHTRKAPGFFNVSQGEALELFASGEAWRVAPGDHPIAPLPKRPEIGMTEEEGSQDG